MSHPESPVLNTIRSSKNAIISKASSRMKVKTVFELKFLKRILKKMQKLLFNTKETPWVSAIYWEKRYRSGGNSGEGSYGRLAAFKAEVINEFVREEGINTVIEHGCGDGNQLALATYPRYYGFDISSKAIHTCRKRYGSDNTKIFKPSSEYRGETADLALSLDVIYHLTEDIRFAEYMKRLTQSASHFIIIYSTNVEQESYSLGSHVRHRWFTEWMINHATEWVLCRRIPNRHPKDSSANFWIYKRTKDPNSERRDNGMNSKSRC